MSSSACSSSRARKIRGSHTCPIAVSLTKGGPDVIRASWGRIHDSIYVQAAPSFGNITPTFTDVYSSKLDGVQDTTRVTPGVFARPTQFGGLLDPGLHAGYINEWHAGYTRQLPHQIAFTAA